MTVNDDRKESGFWPTESELMPLMQTDLSPPGKRSGEGLASILPFLARVLRGKPRPTPLSQEGDAAQPPASPSTPPSSRT